MAKKLTEWMVVQVGKLGVSATPVIGGDINSDFGLHKEQDGKATRTKQKATGPFANKLEKPSGKESRQLCKHPDLVIATTQYDIGDAYYGNEGEAYAEHTKNRPRRDPLASREVDQKVHYARAKWSPIAAHQKEREKIQFASYGGIREPRQQGRADGARAPRRQAESG